MWLGSFPNQVPSPPHVRAGLGEGMSLVSGCADDAHPGSVSSKTTSGREVQAKRHQEFVQNVQGQKKIGTEKHKPIDKTGICTSKTLEKRKSQESCKIFKKKSKL